MIEQQSAALSQAVEKLSPIGWLCSDVSCLYLAADSSRLLGQEYKYLGILEGSRRWKLIMDNVTKYALSNAFSQ